MESLNISLTSMNIPYIKFGHGLNQLEDAHPRKLTAGGPQNDGPWKAGDSGFNYGHFGYLC